MKKILYVARREFLTTVLTRGFLIGLLIVPLMILFMATVFPKLIRSAEKAPRVVGDVAIVDPTGEVAGSLRAYLETATPVEAMGRLNIASRPARRR